MYGKLGRLIAMPQRKIICKYGPTNSYIVSSPIGDVEIVSCPKGLHSVKQVGDTDEYFSPDTRVNVDVKLQLYKDNGYTYKPALQCVEWLQFYFKSSVDQLKLPLLCQSIFTEGSFTSTAQRVLTEKVLYGQTISYKNLAALCGNEKACRAVGMAMRNNPISFIVPCHRVINHSGKLGNYSGGHKNKIKQWLLTHENAIP
ncbi:methylated-DNA--protein-cysteine methyltransferase-like isoform X1 [Mytilus californianus]|uniref:methylated-DNA--protein-cysteine methyltransferase-like isoform X1 n=2 Tax=Mytilus californianus TaxID=6549 RepID=UPI002245DF05|nr:methylated-DNA--protein-cysteine methyltransferase-like isoform X1 [Mytilus californianus]